MAMVHSVAVRNTKAITSGMHGFRAQSGCAAGAGGMRVSSGGTIRVTPRWSYFCSQRFTMPVAIGRTYRCVPPRAGAHRY
jgi:hypothetical protein